MAPDYISSFPESVIHHILSFLPFNDIVRSSVLSKTWNCFWSNYPNIDLDLVFYFAIYNCPLPRFLYSIQQIMDQCLIRKDCIQKLRLSIEFPNMEELAPILDEWLVAAIERNVSELVLKVHIRKEIEDGPNGLYSFPLEVVTHSLKILEIEKCMLEDRFACIELPHLRNFTLNHCKFSGDNLLNKILCGCPVLEFLDIFFCEDVGHFLSVSCKPKLKYFRVYGFNELKKIEILAPSLETFKYSSPYPCAIDLASCTFLKHLELHGAFISADYVPIQYLLSKLLYIEELQLDSCTLVDKIEISSSCVKKLSMRYYIDIDFPGAEIDTPNLIHLEFMPKGVCISHKEFSCWNVPKVEEIHMLFPVKSFRSVCRDGLKGFLMKLNNYENLKLFVVCRGYQNYILLEKLHEVSFSSLNKVFKKAKPEFVIISSRRVEKFLPNMPFPGSSCASLSLIFSSRQSIELLYKKLCNDAEMQFVYSDFQLVSTEEIEHEMDSAWKSFMKTHSTGYQTATVILHWQSWLGGFD